MNVRVSGQQVETKKQTKYLWVLLDEHLTFKGHIVSIKLKPGVNIWFQKRGGTSYSIRKTTGDLGGQSKSSNEVWGKPPESFTIWAFTSTRIANTYVIISADFAL